MNKNNILYMSGLLLVLLPYIFSGFYFDGYLGRSLILESSIFSIDYSNYFSQLYQNFAIFNRGANYINSINYAPLYGLLWLLKSIFGGVWGYIIMCIASVSIAYVYLYKLLEWKKIDIVGTWFVILLAILYITSLSNFNFIKSNFLFTLPFYLLPFILYQSIQYLLSGDRSKLLGLLLCSFFIIFNLTHFIIIMSALVLWILSYFGISFIRNNFSKIFLVSMVFLPGCIILLLASFLNIQYLGDFSVVSQNIAENFYSMNSNFLTIFSQTTDRGLFGQFNGELYYDFSPFYKILLVKILALMPWLGLLILLITNKVKLSTQCKKLLLGLIIIILFMQGNNFFLYDRLYNHFVPFQIFRNITKWSPLLYLILIVLIGHIYTLVTNASIRKLVILLLGLGVLYNVPYRSYSDYFFRDRSMDSLPQYWNDMKNFTNNNLNNNDNILVLPATYVNDFYMWNNRKNSVQGNLMDALSHVKSYRLSEGFVGSPYMQHQMKSCFVSDSTTLRGQNILYSCLSNLVKQWGMNYVLLTKDLVNEYQNFDDMYQWLEKEGYTLLYEAGKLQLFQNKKLSHVTITFSSGLEFLQLNNFRYNLSLNLPSADSKGMLRFLQSFHNGWKLYPGKKAECVGENKTYSGNTLNKSVGATTYMKPLFYIAVTGDNRSRVSKKNNIDIDLLHSYNTGVKLVFPVKQKFIVGFDETEIDSNRMSNAIPIVGYYSIQTGDTLKKIARQYHVVYQKLLEVNDLTSDIRLRPFDEVKIPVSENPQAPTSGIKIISHTFENIGKNFVFESTIECIEPTKNFFQNNSISYFWRDTLRSMEHRVLTGEYGNVWDIYLKENTNTHETYLAKGLREGWITNNIDGSYQVHLTLYFYPQIRLYIGLLCVGGITLLIVGYGVLNRGSKNFISFNR